MAISTRQLTPVVGAEVPGCRFARPSRAREESDHRQFRPTRRAPVPRSEHQRRRPARFQPRRFGDLDPPPNQENGRRRPPGYPDIYVVSNVLDDAGAPIGALGSGEAVWHTDMSYLDVPPVRLDALCAGNSAERRQHLALRHGAAAGRRFPTHLSRAIAGRRIKHDGTYNSGGFLRKGVTPTDDPHKAPGAWHPSLCPIPRPARRCCISGGAEIPMSKGYDADEFGKAAG